MEKENDFGFKVFIKILELKEYKNKKEVMKTAMEMLQIAKNKNSSEQVINSFDEAIKKLDGLSFKEIKKARAICMIFNKIEKKTLENAK